ncbi:MAG: ATP-binding protein [Acidobacteriota bacterium]|nr:ATP-binding protein [Acidobacteriota bacterium]
MTVITRLKNTLVRNRIYIGHLGLLILFLLGLMNVVYILGFREPTDGVVWKLNDDNQLAVDGFILDDARDMLQPGDVVLFINDVKMKDMSVYRAFLDEAVIGAPYLYDVIRDNDVTLEHWIKIAGVKDPDHRRYFPFALTGFIYLTFLFLMVGQKVSYGSRGSAILFSLCVFLAFAFYRTNHFSTLDWTAYFIDYLGNALLPSALAGMVFSHALARTRWLPFVQALHWAPTLLLLLLKSFFLLRFTQHEESAGSEPAEILDSMEMLQSQWAGGLIIAAVIAGMVIAELRFRKGNFSWVWLISWIPFALRLLEVPLPFLDTGAALAPIILPVVLLAEWSRQSRLYLGEIGKKVLVYCSVVITLTAGYALFIIIFQALLGDKISSAAHETVLGIAIMFAAITYAPAKHLAGELVDRMIYGKRLTPIRNLSDFSNMNRADTRIDDFLANTLGRIRDAFEVEKGEAYKVGETPRIFRGIEVHNREQIFVFEEVPPQLLAGKIVRGHQAHAQTPESGDNPFAPNDFICPIRVSGELSALIVYSLEGNNPKISAEEERLLTSLLQQCDVLMENMELYHSVTQKAISINQLKEYNENIIESSRMGILTTDEMDKAVSFNSALVELAGLDRDTIMHKTFDELFIVRELNSRRMVRAGQIMEGRFENAAGERYLLEIQKNPLKTKENEVYGNLYLVEDIKEKKEFDEKLMQQEKLASIGLLAAGVAHEINTPLTGIASYAQMLAGAGLEEDDRELVDLIQGQSQRAARIVSELLNFSRKGDEPKGPVNLSEVLGQTLRFLSHQISKSKVMVTVNEPKEAAIVDGYGNQIQQVFVNLIVNAMDAMPDGGTLAVSFFKNRHQIGMSFKDSGLGMDEDTRRNIFDPFFTTKEVGKGTGLGLAVVYNILQNHGAGTDVKSTPGEGTDFRLYFPKRQDNRTGDHNMSREAGTTLN